MGNSEKNPFLPKWHRDLEVFSKICSVLVIEGNVYDKYMYHNNILDINSYLYNYLSDNGYGSIVSYDMINKRFWCPQEQSSDDSMSRFMELLEFKKYQDSLYRSVEVFTDDLHNLPVVRTPFKTTGNNSGSAPMLIRKVMTQHKCATAVIVDFASRLINNPANVVQDENDAFTALQKAGLEYQKARKVQKDDEIKTVGTLNNLIILVVSKMNDLPSWFYLNNPVLKTVHIDTPNVKERQFFIDNYFKGFFNQTTYQSELQKYENNPSELKKIKDKFIGKTEGMSLLELNSLRELSKLRNLTFTQLPSIIDFYRFGELENPWESPDLVQQVKNYRFEDRVMGQPAAIAKTREVLKRAITGLSGIQHSSSHSKPRGVLFFAGPTGTGKTETAKALSELIFRDEKNCIRFDMSEFSQPHSDQRLLGAPPGYVGYEAGGQLTNAVREHPFSILLFDEIEKAHPSILDKFLQLLEDGRMTDGQGNTVYFSECIIIFTSNLGITEEDSSTGRRRMLVSPSDSYETVDSKVRKGVDDYFKFKLGRPEILNRIGDNIVVFDFIRPEIAGKILRSQIDKIRRNLKAEKDINLEIDNILLEDLSKLVNRNLDNGGRGIGNIVESHFINPLSSYIFDNDIRNGSTLRVRECIKTDTGIKLLCNDDPRPTGARPVREVRADQNSSARTDASSAGVFLTPVSRTRSDLKETADPDVSTNPAEKPLADPVALSADYSDPASSFSEEGRTSPEQTNEDTAGSSAGNIGDVSSGNHPGNQAVHMGELAFDKIFGVENVQIGDLSNMDQISFAGIKKKTNSGSKDDFLKS